MPIFQFEAKDGSGKNITGEMTAVTEREAVAQLHKEGYFVSSLRARTPPQPPRDFGLWRKVLEPIFLPVGSKALAIYFSSFASMLNSGMGIHEVVEQLAERAPGRTLRKVSQEMAAAVLEGKPITTVMPRYPAAFSPLVMALLEAGNISGMLEKAMRQLSEYFEHSYELENLARFETFYTKLLVLALISIPTLPILVTGSFQAWLPVILYRLGVVVIALAVLWYGWRGLMRLGFLRQGVDRLKLLIPWIGGIVRKGAIARWCRSMAMLYDAGVPVHAALAASALASGNAALGASVNRLSYKVLAGDPVSEVMEESGEFPDQAIGMMITGEKSGSVSTSLEKVAEFYEEEVRVSGKQAVLLASMAIYGLVLAVMAFYIVSSWTGYYKGIMNTYGNWGE